jgi:type III secretory pathway component EscS
MTDATDLAQLASEGLALSLALSLPIVGIAALVSLVTALLQAATQVQDATIAHLPRFVAVVVALAVLARWMGQELVAFATLAFGGV